MELSKEIVLPYSEYIDFSNVTPNLNSLNESNLAVTCYLFYPGLDGFWSLTFCLEFLLLGITRLAYYFLVIPLLW